MFGKIIYIDDQMAKVEVNKNVKLDFNLMNVHVVFEDEKMHILGEIANFDGDVVDVKFLGEFIENRFLAGVIRKPTLLAKTRIITEEELALIVGKPSPSSFELGKSPLYDGITVNVDINDFFSNHFAIFGNTGSGKSSGFARIIQNVFSKSDFIPLKSNFFIFDSYGEYHNAFEAINKINPNYNFKFYTTNVHKVEGELLRVPLWLLNVDELALLLSATDHSQLLIIERMQKLVKIFAEDSKLATKYKNHLIAKSIMTILYTNQTSSSKRNDIFTILSTCATEEFNLEAPVRGVGYVRKFRECFTIDTSGNFTESVLVTSYISNFMDDELEKYESNEELRYDISDLEDALNFTLISEGLLRNDKLYNEAITLKVRLHSLVISGYSKFFEVDKYITLENYVASLVTFNGRKAQIININLEDVDDWFAKAITKIFAKIFFNFTKRLKDRASIPFHILLEEAHRYVQNDNDVNLLGYNIFERVSKEGRKYGLVLNLISQRPVEISSTVISQCANFLIFKMNQPQDIEYIRTMLPNVSAEIVDKQKILQPGTCVAFGQAFKLPLLAKMEMPNPAPKSSNANITKRWVVNGK